MTLGGTDIKWNRQVTSRGPTGKFNKFRYFESNLEDFGGLLQLILAHWVLFYVWEFWFSTGESKDARHHRMFLTCQFTETNITYAKYGSGHTRGRNSHFYSL